MFVECLTWIKYRLGTWHTEGATTWWESVGESGFVLNDKDYGLELETAGTENSVPGWNSVEGW